MAPNRYQSINAEDVDLVKNEMFAHSPTLLLRSQGRRISFVEMVHSEGRRTGSLVMAIDGSTLRFM